MWRKRRSSSYLICQPPPLFLNSIEPNHCEENHIITAIGASDKDRSGYSSPSWFRFQTADLDCFLKFLFVKKCQTPCLGGKPQLTIRTGNCGHRTHSECFFSKENNQKFLYHAYYCVTFQRITGLCKTILIDCYGNNNAQKTLLFLYSMPQTMRFSSLGPVLEK